MRDARLVERPKTVLRIEVAQPLAQVGLEEAEIRAAEELLGQGEAGHEEALVRHSVLLEPAQDGAAGHEVFDPGLSGIRGDPDAVYIGVADDAIDASVAGHVGGDRRRVVGSYEGKRLRLDPLDHALAEPLPDHGLGPLGLYRGLGQVDSRIGRLDLLEVVHYPEEGVSDERDALARREPLVDRKELLPNLQLVGTGDRRVVDDDEASLRDVPQGPDRPFVPQAHVRRRHPGADLSARVLR